MSLLFLPKILLVDFFIKRFSIEKIKVQMLDQSKKLYCTMTYICFIFSWPRGLYHFPFCYSKFDKYLDTDKVAICFRRQATEYSTHHHFKNSIRTFHTSLQVQYFPFFAIPVQEIYQAYNIIIKSYYASCLQITIFNIFP